MRRTRFLFELAWRDLAASGRSLWVFCACLVLGVTLVAATGGLYRLVHAGLLADTRVLMGGDLEVESSEPLPDRALEWMAARGEISLLTELDTMLGTAGGEYLRVELQTVDDAYPLYGELELSPNHTLADVTALRGGRFGVAIDPVLAGTLGIGVADIVYIGSLEAEVRALVRSQPDRSLSAEWRGAPVLLSADAVAASGLVRPGSRVEYEYRVRTGMDAAEWRSEFYEAFPDDDWEVNTFTDRSRRISERLGQIASGLLIIAFSTLFIGGLGVFNSIRSYLEGKLATIATLRALGLRDARLAIVYLLQIVMLAGGASAAGALVGTALALAGAAIVAARVPMQTTLASAMLPGVVAISFGLLTALAFALPAIGRALSVPPAALFRGAAKDTERGLQAWRTASLACGGMVGLLVLVTLPDRLFALAFITTIGLLLLLLDGIVRAIKRLARRLDDHPMLSGRFALRLALANLHRPGTPLRASLLSLGSALTLLVACTLVTAALVRAVNETIPEESPALVLYDVGDRQVAEVRDVIEALPSTERVETTPLVRARIAEVNGVPIDEFVGNDRPSRRDAGREEHDLSYSAGNIDDVTLAAGAWWPEPASGRPKMALEDWEADRLGVGVGDVITFAIEGRQVEVETAAIFSQKGVQTRFWFEAIVSDGALDGFVNRHVGTAFLSDADAIVAQRRIGEIAPNVVTVRTAALLESARQILGKAAASLAVVAAVSLAASLLVLVSVMAAGRARQVYDATVLHSLGTRLGVIRRSLHLEYLLLAAITSSFAVLLGSGVALLLLRVRLKLPAEDLLWLAVATAALVSGLSLSLGARYLSRRLRPRPAVLLREG